MEEVEEYLRMEAAKERAAKNKKITIPYLFHLLILSVFKILIIPLNKIKIFAKHLPSSVFFIVWCVLINFCCFMIAIFLVE